MAWKSFRRCGTICPDAVRILVTGQAELGVAINNVGIYKFILKPWNEKDLMVMVKRALEHYQLIQEGKVLVEMLDIALRQQKVKVRGL